MHSAITTSLYILLILFSMLPRKLIAQIDKSVVVVKPYEPSVQEASKLSVFPEFEDSLGIRPEINYSVHPRSIESRFEVDPIKPARLVGLPLEKLYKTYLKLGMGTKLSPIAELNIHSLRKRQGGVGMNIRHESTGGKVRLDNDEKVFSGFSETAASLYGRMIFRESTLYGQAGFTHYNIHHYGYDPEIDTTLEKDQTAFDYVLGDAVIRWKSTHDDSVHFNYDLGFEYQYAGQGGTYVENGFLFSASLGKMLEQVYLGMEADISHQTYSEAVDSSSYTLVSFHPYIEQRTEAYKYRLGMNLTSDITQRESNLSIHPVALLQINVVDQVMVPYLGLEGRVENNSYRNILQENYFIRPDQRVRNTNKRIVGYGGVMGHLSHHSAYNVRFSYALIDNMHFFVNDTSNILGNSFIPVYDDSRVTEILAELKIKLSDDLGLRFRGQYFAYELEEQEEAWHMPDFQMQMNGRYNLRDKILAGAELLVVGQRYARDGDALDPVKLKSVFDLNLGIEYRYTKVLSVFLKLNNITNSRYFRWNQYPSYGFTLLAGFTYAL